MKRFTLLTLVACVALSFAATAEAGNGKKNRGFGFEQFLGSGNLGGMISKFVNKKHDDDDDDDKPTPPPIDPGKGDGKPEKPKPTMPGYVWVGDHWERAKATDKPTMIVDPVPGTIVVRDHRTISQGAGGVSVTATPIVRDHRTLNGASSIYQGAVVRDHRGSSQGGGSSNPLNGLLHGVNGAANTVGDAAGMLGRTVTSGAKGIGRTLGSAAGSVGSAVGGAAKGVGRTVSGAADAVGDAIGSVLPF